MKNARPLLLAASAVALLISACSQAPADLEGPTLAPQFGSTDDDFGRDVALTPAGDVYVLAEQSGYIYDEYGQNGEYVDALLKRYDSRDTLLFSEKIGSSTCDDGGYEECSMGRYGAKSLHADANGSTYALIENGLMVDDTYRGKDYIVKKMNASGTVVGSMLVGTTIYGFGSDTSSNDFLDVTVDKNGAVYVAKRQFDYDYETDPYTNVIAKYTTNGALVWQRTSTVGIPKGITVAASGNVYVVGSTGVSRYTNSGGLTWTKSGGGDDITISGSSLYVRKGTTIRRYDGSGSLLWAKTQSGLTNPVFADMTGDGSGNVYLTGKVSTVSSGRDAFIRKLSSSGSVIWTKQYGTSADDTAQGIATVDGSAVYTAGSTQGSLAGTNLGGSDGYVRKVDASGNRVWTR